MKHLALTLALLSAPFIATTVPVDAMNHVLDHTDYCDGWEAGWKAGWCYDVNYGCMPPIPPLCPIPQIGRDSFQDGYNRGFVKGMWEKQN